VPARPKSRASVAAVRRAVHASGDRRAAPKVPWISKLTGASPREISEVLAETDDLVGVEEELRAAHVAAGRTFYAQIRAPFDLYALVRLTRPDHVVEAGVSSGISSAHFLLGLTKNRHGRLHSIDKPVFQRGPELAKDESGVSIPPGRTSGWAVPAHLRRNWDLRIGPSQQLLPPLVDELPSVGIFLHDDLHTPSHLTFELRTIQPKLAAGAVVLADNTVWTGEAFPRFARELGARPHRHGRSDLVGLRVPGRSISHRRR
jgi:hypothetical protein